MEKTIQHALWLTFLLYLIISFFNTAGLASHFEPNWWISSTWALALELGDITLLLGTLKRKQEGKPYGGYLITFLISLAVSIAANVAEWTNNFLGENVIYTNLHDFEYPWIIPALLGVTIPALMLATGSLLSDFSGDKVNTGMTNRQIHEETSMNQNGSGHHSNSEDRLEATEKKKTNDNQMDISLQRLSLQNKSRPLEPVSNYNGIIENFDGTRLSYEELFTKSVQELSERFNVSKKTIYNWRARAQKEKEPA